MDAQDKPPDVALSSPGSAALRFGPYILDLDGCALTGSDGAEIALTRGEFALLREFVRCPGRALSRDHLLDVLAGRRSEPFDRSIDMLVARLRRKIEPDPKRPALIVTVAGQGYKLAVPVSPVPPPEAVVSPGVAIFADPPAAPLHKDRRFRLTTVVVLAIMAVATWSVWQRKPSPVTLPTITVLPFTNLSGDTSQDYFGPGLAAELTTLLATFPTLRVMPAFSAEMGTGRDIGIAEAARLTGARYVLKGGVQKTGDRIHVTAQLYETADAASVWAEHFDATGRDIIGMQSDIADRIYQSLAGMKGAIQHNEEWADWRKSAASLDELDYYVRGLPFHMRFTPEGQMQAREIWQAGVTAFPNSPLLRIKLAWTYLVPVQMEFSDTPAADIERAYRLVTEATRSEPISALATWYGHWITACLYQWHDNDFVRSVSEARAAVAMAPYDTLSRNDLSQVLADAGHFKEAAEWAEWSIQHDPNGPSWYFWNLAFAYWGLGRYQDAVDLAEGGKDVLPVYLAVNYVRLGRLPEARAAIVAALKVNPHDTVALEATFPLIEPYKKALLDDMRTAGLPEK